MKKGVLFSVFLLLALVAIGFIFWEQEYQFSLPTPKPEGITSLAKGDSVDLVSKGLPYADNLFIHFYNYDCPCSRFNISEFEHIIRAYAGDVTFVAVLPGQGLKKEEAKWFKEKYDLGIPVIIDSDNKITASLGIYSTPQALIIKQGKVFYTGNYNKSRFCTSRNTGFAEMALEALVNDKQPPVFPAVATVAYGCPLPGNSKNKSGLLEMLNMFK